MDYDTENQLTEGSSYILNRSKRIARWDFSNTLVDSLIELQLFTVKR